MVAALLIKAIGKQLVCVHVNHGLLRKGEPEQVVQVFRHQMDANLVYVDAVDRFLDKLAGVEEPERKRKIIGAEFIRVFEEEARKQEDIKFLAQGTIYPDILESDGVKAHHNVGGLPDDLQFELVEQLRLLFKTKCASSARRWACRIRWSTVSRSLVLVWECAVWGLSLVTAWKLFANRTPSCVKNSNWQAWTRKYGNISP